MEDSIAKPLTCRCVSRHAPKAVVVEEHHIEPKSWGGSDTADNKIPLCVQTHYTVHEILDLYVHAGGTPPVDRLRPYPPYARIVAAQGWTAHMANHPDHPTPYGP